MRTRHLIAAAISLTFAAHAHAGGADGFTTFEVGSAEHGGVVTEFFSFDTPESQSGWQAPGALEHERVPFIQTAHQEVQARGYYAALLLADQGEHEAFQKAMFAASRQGQAATSEAAVVRLAEASGYDAEIFKRVMSGNAVGAKVGYAKELAAQMKPQALPTVVVEGKYRTDPQVAGGPDRMVKVLDRLVAR